MPTKPMISERVAQATSYAIEATKTAKSLDEARNAYYANPGRTLRKKNEQVPLFVAVAFAVWDGFALDYAATILGLCGKAEFPTEMQITRTLAYFAREILLVEEGSISPDLEILRKLILSDRETPAQLSDDDVVSILAHEVPTGGEAERFLCTMFPNSIFFIPNAERIMEEKMIKEFGTPDQIIAKLHEEMSRLSRVNAGLQTKLGMN